MRVVLVAWLLGVAVLGCAAGDDIDPEFTLEDLINETPELTRLPYGTEAQSDCFEIATFEFIGYDRFVTAGLKPGDDLRVDYNTLGLTDDEMSANAIDNMNSCGLTEDFLVWQVVQTEDADADHIRCTVSRLDEASKAELMDNIFYRNELWADGSDAARRLVPLILGPIEGCPG